MSTPPRLNVDSADSDNTGNASPVVGESFELLRGIGLPQKKRLSDMQTKVQQSQSEQTSLSSERKTDAFPPSSTLTSHPSSEVSANGSSTSDSSKNVQFLISSSTTTSQPEPPLPDSIASNSSAKSSHFTSQNDSIISKDLDFIEADDNGPAVTRKLTTMSQNANNLRDMLLDDEDYIDLTGHTSSSEPIPTHNNTLVRFINSLAFIKLNTKKLRPFKNQQGKKNTLHNPNIAP
jgi:hypothetical protein